jgi:RNA polymerase sigma-70 factor (ECF subfamily)
MSSADLDSSEQPARTGAFTTTHWSVVLAAADAGSPRQAEALEKLCRTYWYPLYAYARQCGNIAADAQDLTQSFFAHFLEKDRVSRANPERGRFRSFLLMLFKNYLTNEWHRARAQKRGGGQTIFSLDAAAAEGRYVLEPTESVTPVRAFEKAWAVSTLEQALARLRQEYADAGKAALYEKLNPFLLGEKPAETSAELARQLEMSEAALRMAVTRMRQRCRAALRHEVAHTVERPEDADDELRHLLAVLRN